MKLLTCGQWRKDGHPENVLSGKEIVSMAGKTSERLPRQSRIEDREKGKYTKRENWAGTVFHRYVLTGDRGAERRSYENCD